MPCARVAARTRSAWNDKSRVASVRQDSMTSGSCPDKHLHYPCTILVQIDSKHLALRKPATSRPVDGRYGGHRFSSAMHGRRIIIQTLHPASGTTCIIPPQELSHLVGGEEWAIVAEAPAAGRGRHRTANVPRDFAAHRGATAAATARASMKRFDCHAFKRNRQEECVQMPVKIAS